MNVQQIRENVNGVLGGAYSAQLYFVLKEDSNFVLKLADLESEKTTQEVENLFSEYVKKLIIENEELQVCELSIAEERANAIYHYDYEEYPEELSIFHEFDINASIEFVERFNFANDDLSRLYGYVIYLGSMENGVVLFKKHYPISLIKRDSFLLGAVKSKSRFEKISSEDIIRLNETVQLIKIGEEIYVVDLKVLERNMGFSQLIYKAAEDAVSAIEEVGILEDIQVLKDASEDIAYARKLSKVKKGSPILSLEITNGTIIEFTKTTPGLIGKFKYSEDGTRIRLDTKKSKEAFIKLMNDAFLRSELTKQYYEAKAKDNITNEQADVEN